MILTFGSGEPGSIPGLAKEHYNLVTPAEEPHPSEGVDWRATTGVDVTLEEG